MRPGCLRMGLREVDWIYKVCLPQHSDAPPSAFYPVNQFCCFVLFKELCLWKRMLSACRFSLSPHDVYHGTSRLWCCCLLQPVASVWMMSIQNAELLQVYHEFDLSSLFYRRAEVQFWCWFDAKWPLRCTLLLQCWTHFGLQRSLILYGTALEKKKQLETFLRFFFFTFWWHHHVADAHFSWCDSPAPAHLKDALIDQDLSDTRCGLFLL